MALLLLSAARVSAAAPHASAQHQSAHQEPSKSGSTYNDTFWHCPATVGNPATLSADEHKLL